MLSRVTKRKWGQRRRSQPRFQASPWDSYRVWILGLVQVRIQERATLNKRRFFFFQGEIHSTDRVKGKRPWNMWWLVFIVWVISQANKKEDYFNCLEEGAGISGNWVTVHFLAFHRWPQHCHGSWECAIWYADGLQRAYNEVPGILKVNHTPPWT